MILFFKMGFKQWEFKQRKKMRNPSIQWDSTSTAQEKQKQGENSGGLNSLLTAIRAICFEIMHIVQNQAAVKGVFQLLWYPQTTD